MPEQEILRFAEFELNLAQRALSRGGSPVPLTPKAFDLLTELATGSPGLLSKEYLLSKVWPDTFISEATLAQNIHTIRSALEIPRAIVTVPKSGYRFTLTVERVLVAEENAETARVPGTRPNWLRPLAAAMVLIAVIGVLAKAGASVAASHRADQLAQDGLVLMRRSDHAGLAEAAAHFREALEVDSQNALATAGQAEASRRLGYLTPAFRLQLAERSVALDPACGECHGILGSLLMTDHWAWERAGRELQAAVDCDPENYQSRIWQSQYFAATGKGAESIRAAREAVRLAPGRASPYVMLAGAFYLSAKFHEAIVEHRKALAITPDMPSALGWNFQTLLMQKRHHEALEVKLRADSSYSGFSADTVQKLLTEMWARWERTGFQGELRWKMQEYTQPEAANHHRYDRAIWRMMLGEQDQALDELEAALEQRSFQLIYLKLDPIFGPLHGTPRFQAVLRKMGL